VDDSQTADVVPALEVSPGAGGRTSAGEHQAVEFTGAPTMGDVFGHGVESDRQSVGAMATGGFISAMNAVDLWNGIPFNPLWVAVGIAFLLGIGGGMVAIAMHLLRRQGGPVTYRADADGLTISIGGRSKHQAWSVFRQVRESSNALTLDAGNFNWTLIGTRGVADDVIDRLRAILRDASLVTAKRRGFGESVLVRGTGIGVALALVFQWTVGGLG